MRNERVMLSVTTCLRATKANDDVYTFLITVFKYVAV